MDSARGVALAGMLVSGALAALKIAVGLLAQSTSVLADGFESAGDVLASAMVFVGLTYAAKPADDNHPYGHGRAETLAGLLLGMMLALGGVAITIHALAYASDVKSSPAAYALAPLFISVAAKAVMMTVKYRQGKRTGSTALAADARNDAIDLLSAVVAIVAVSLSVIYPARFLYADHYGAALIGAIMVITGSRIVKETGEQLMDTMPDEKFLAEIRGAAVRVSGVRGVEKCFARKTGLKYHVDIHIEVDPEITVSASHEIARGVRERVRLDLPWIEDTLVHVEPSPARYARAMETFPNITLNAGETKVVQEPFGVLRLYFEGRTDLLSGMTAGSLLLNPGESPHPPHQHPEEEFLLVTEGTGEILCDGETKQAGPGALMYCAGMKWHGITNTGSTPLLFYFFKWLA